MYFLTMKIYPIQQERRISFCQTFLWQSFSAWLACVFAPNSSANKVVKEATMLRCAHVRRCQIIITDSCLFFITKSLKEAFFRLKCLFLQTPAENKVQCEFISH